MLVIATFLGCQNAKEPFCESSNKWFGISPSQPLIFIEAPDTLIGQLEIGNVSQLIQLKLLIQLLNHNIVN